MRKSKTISSILDAVNVAAVALIIAVCIEMGKDTLVDWRTILIAFVSLIVVFGFKKLNSAFIVLRRFFLRLFTNFFLKALILVKLIYRQTDIVVSFKTIFAKKIINAVFRFTS